MSEYQRQIKAMLLATKMLAECIRELREVPSGHLYAMVMGVMNLQTYEVLIGNLKRAGLVSEKYHLLTWIGSDQYQLEFVDSTSTKEATDVPL